MCPHRNIGRLEADCVDDGTRVAVETNVRAVVADIANYAADSVLDVTGRHGC